MENDAIEFLRKPKMNVKQLNYIMSSISVYTNLFEIQFKKEIKLFQYPFSVSPPIGNNDIRIRNRLFKACFNKLKNIFGDCFISGDCLYNMKKIDEAKYIKCVLYLKGKTEYDIIIDRCINERLIRQENIQKDPLTKQFIEMIIKDILHSNPKLEDYNGLFVLKGQKKEIYSEVSSIKLYPCFTTSFVEVDNGNYLNVSLKNKIIKNETIYDYLNQFKYKNNTNAQNEIKENLKGRFF